MEMAVIDYSDVDDESITSSQYHSGIKRTKRDTPPAHYILKIKSFSQLLEILRKTGDCKYESETFEAGGYKWKLVLYPNGNREGYISMYVASNDQKAIANGCHVNAFVNFFVYDHIRDKYLSVQDGKVKRYHLLRTENGFDELLSLDKFNDSTNGYLVNDCCVFGAEVHVITKTVKVNEFSVITDPEDCTFTWKIDKFSTLQNMCSSGTFNVGGHQWKMCLYPKGDSSEVKDRWLSLYMELVLDKDGTTEEGQGVYAECKVSIKDQIHGNHKELTLENYWFGLSTASWGYRTFMLLSDVNDASKGFLVDDTLVAEAKISIVSAVQDLS